MRFRSAEPFDHPDYLFEPKQDGLRTIAYIDKGKCDLVSRKSQDFPSFAVLKGALAYLRVDDAILDGEIVWLDEDRVSRFQQIFNRRKEMVETYAVAL